MEHISKSIAMCRLLTLIVLSFSLLACGGGSSGGNGDFIGAGRVSIEVAPRKIDVGDRMLVRVTLEDGIEDGVQLKVRYPDALDYVLDSATISSAENRSRDEITPDIDVKINGQNYLIFFIGELQLDENGDADIEFQLVGRERVLEGKVAVDADVDDPLIDNSEEFDPERPEFQQEAESSIEVVD